MMYGMFGEQILNNVLFALKRADNLPTDIYGAFKQNSCSEFTRTTVFVLLYFNPSCFEGRHCQSSISITLI